uniref:Wsv334 n=1 Tax=White spot syndrome virus TaxID=92652 RepID=A0A2U9G6M9_WSSV|nr:wsv334 [Shrimp white spot syndrome virus]
MAHFQKDNIVNLARVVILKHLKEHTQRFVQIFPSTLCWIRTHEARKHTQRI